MDTINQNMLRVDALQL